MILLNDVVSSTLTRKVLHEKTGETRESKSVFIFINYSA